MTFFVRQLVDVNLVWQYARYQRQLRVSDRCASAGSASSNEISPAYATL